MAGRGGWRLPASHFWVCVIASFRPYQLFKSLSAIAGVILFVFSDSLIVLGRSGVIKESDSEVMAAYIFLLIGK